MFDQLETRELLSTLFVNNTNDSGVGSLRQAVLDANNQPGADTIKFKNTALGTITLASQLTLTGDTEINGPSADGLTVSGGGVSRVFKIEAGATVTIKKLKITNGSVAGIELGGGIQNLGTLTLKDSVVTGNFATVQGGGISNRGILNISRSKVTANRATNSGGGLHNAGTGVVSIDRSTISDNICNGDGAGIRSEVGTTLTITGSTISGNSGGGFGTGGIASGATLTIRDSLIADNTSAAAGIYLFGSSNGGNVLISRSVIRNNRPNATSPSGVGGIWSRSSNTIRIEDSVIRNNTGNSYQAGGVYGRGKFEIARSEISGNTGSGINTFYRTTISDSTISNNAGGRVGGVSVSDGLIENSTISGNTGSQFGGIQSYSLELVRSTVSGNSVIPSGETSSGVGGVSITNGLIQNSTISGNVVVADQMVVYHGYYGDTTGDAIGGVWVNAGSEGSVATIENSTIAFNRVTGAPADIRTSGGVLVALPFSFTGYYGDTYTSATASVRNTIIARNEANIGGPDVGGEFQSGGHNLIGVLGSDATGFDSSDLKGTTAIPLDPRLRPLGNYGGPTRTHALYKNSRALNAGDNTGAPMTDQRGSNRISGGTIDIGAYEARFVHGFDLSIDCIGFAIATNPEFRSLAWTVGDSSGMNANLLAARIRQQADVKAMIAKSHALKRTPATIDSLFNFGHSSRNELDWLDAI